MKKIKTLTLVALLMVSMLSLTKAQKQSIYEPLNLDEVEYSFEDFGKMWTFDALPMEDYKKQLGFTPSEEWLDHVQKSALQFGGGCSGSFVSEDGLIMTNHHCIRGRLSRVQKEGEDIFKNGYYASKMEEERRFPNLYVDQLMKIEEVTEDIHAAMKKGETDEEKSQIKKDKIKELEKQYEEETGLTCKVVTLYNGGKYSMYIYKRYDDIRLVFAPDVQIAATGWDWDNFTYPRYELDFAFVRAYDDNGEPVKVKNHFTWADKEAKEGEASFIIGRPGNTDRLLSMRQLEYFRDTRHPTILNQFNEVYKAYFEYFQDNPGRRAELLSQLLSVANGRKAYAGMLMGLKNEYLMKKKGDFEKSLKNKVEDNEALNEEYGNIWEKIDKTIDKTEEDGNKILPFFIAGIYQSQYHGIAERLVRYAIEMEKPEEERSKAYKKSNLEKTKKRIYQEIKDAGLQKLLAQAHERFLRKEMGDNCKFLSSMYNNKQGEQATEYLLNKSQIEDKEFVNGLVEKGPEAIKNTDDPLIQYFVKTMTMMEKTEDERNKLNSRMEVLNQRLGRLIFEAYGDKIPPDATSTLRISHGKLKGYKYNGTLAPAKTTFYGLWDRYYSFGADPYPWGLHERWKEVPEGLDLKTSIGFATTNDIVGGNSGSAIVNKDAEVIGLVHDGNIESLAGDYAFLPENNRAVASDAIGMMEALKHVYKTERLIYELKNSKMKK